MAPERQRIGPSSEGSCGFPFRCTKPLSLGLGTKEGTKETVRDIIQGSMISVQHKTGLVIGLDVCLVRINVLIFVLCRAIILKSPYL